MITSNLIFFCFLSIPFSFIFSFFDFYQFSWNFITCELVSLPFSSISAVVEFVFSMAIGHKRRRREHTGLRWHGCRRMRAARTESKGKERREKETHRKYQKQINLIMNRWPKIVVPCNTRAQSRPERKLEYGMAPAHRRTNAWMNKDDDETDNHDDDDTTKKKCVSGKYFIR